MRSDRAPGPASHSYFSQRLRLHYVDWGNPEAAAAAAGPRRARPLPELGLDGRGAAATGWHVIAPDLRGHGDSQWSPDGSYTMAGYIYDLAQLIHQQRLAPVTIVAHSLGGNIALRYAGIYPETVARLVAIEGLGPSPRVLRGARGEDHRRRRMDEWIREQRARRPPAAALRVDRGRLPPHAGGEPPPLRRAGAPPHRARRQPERGRDLQLEVRQLRAGLVALRHARRATSRISGRASTCPTLLLYGKESRSGNPAGRWPRRATSATPRVVGVDGAGHWLHHDRLDEFLRVVGDFLAA